MIFKIPALVKHMSSIMSLEASLFISPLRHTHSRNTSGTSELTPGRISAPWLDPHGSRVRFQFHLGRAPLLTPPLFQEGDVILTSTPPGVCSVKLGDKVDCRLKIEFEAAEWGGMYEFRG